MKTNVAAKAAGPRAASPKALRRAPTSERLEIAFALVEVTRLMRAAFDERMRELGLTGAHVRLLVRLARHDGQTQAGLARQLEVTPVALGELIDRLEKSGYVERRADPNDRRKWRIHLTGQATELLPTIYAAGEGMQAEMFQDLSAAEIAALGGTLGKLRARIRDMRGAAGEEENES
jgi:DNA-binding MarR family transcriptional regulator